MAVCYKFKLLIRDGRCRLCHCRRVDNELDVEKLGAVNNVDNVNNVNNVEIPTIKVLVAFRKHPYSRNKNLRKVTVLNALYVNFVLPVYVQLRPLKSQTGNI
jgi:hypothetical protein